MMSDSDVSFHTGFLGHEAPYDDEAGED